MKRMSSLISLMVLLAIVLSACAAPAAPAAAPTEVPAAEPAEATAAPEAEAAAPTEAPAEAPTAAPTEAPAEAPAAEAQTFVTWYQYDQGNEDPKSDERVGNEYLRKTLPLFNEEFAGTVGLGESLHPVGQDSGDHHCGSAGRRRSA